jgi:isocitrate dehydrogenase (NAD+)
VGKDIEGLNQANPVSMIMSSALMLRHLELKSHAKNIEDAVIGVVADGSAKTLDLGGTASTSDFCNQVMERI